MPLAAAPDLGPRVLVLTASVGAGHDGPARVLAGELRRERPDARVEVVDGLAAMGPVLSGVAERGAGVMSRRVEWLLDLEYLVFARLPVLRHLGQALLFALGAPGLLRLVREHAPDVVVSTYPGVTEVLRRLRRLGALDVPLCSAITDLSALRYWAGPGIDLHLVTHPEAMPEVRRLAGPRARVEWVRGLVDPAFLDELEAPEARRALELPEDAPVIVVSGGGWGVGDLVGAVEAALEVPDTVVVALCGRNEQARALLERRFRAEPRVRVLGFTERMSELLAAADVLVHSSAGLTALEGLMRGCRVISYGWGVAHIRLNNRAYARFGLVQVAATRRELAAALRRALAEPAAPDRSAAARPSAASLVLAESGRR